MLRRLALHAWRELWDPASERVFYFNIITGVRQLEMPDALKNDVGGAGAGEFGCELGRRWGAGSPNPSVKYPARL